MTEYLPFTIVVIACTVPIGLAARGAHRQFAHPHPAAHTIDWPPSLADWRVRSKHDHRPAAQLTVTELHLRTVFRQRHTIHCAACGRFATRSPIFPTMVLCRTHGLTNHTSTRLEPIAE